jgi:hypothetical protein
LNYNPKPVGLAYLSKISIEKIPSSVQERQIGWGEAPDEPAREDTRPTGNRFYSPAGAGFFWAGLRRYKDAAPAVPGKTLNALPIFILEWVTGAIRLALPDKHN